MNEILNNYYFSRLIFIIFITLIGISVINDSKNKYKINIKDKINIKNINFTFLFKMLFLSLFLRILIELIINLIDMPKTIVVYPVNVLEIIIEFIATCIFAPLFEEIIFRFGLYEKITKKFNFGISIILTSIIFSFIHFYKLDGFIVLLVISLIWNYTYYKTNNLLYPILFHFVHNLYALISIFIFNDYFYMTLCILSFILYAYFSIKKEKS